MLALDEIADTGQVSPLHISVEVDLDDTIADSLTEVIDAAAGSSVEDEVDGLALGRADLLLDVFLVLLEELRSELDVTY